MTTFKEENRNLVFLAIGLGVGLFSAIAVNILSGRYPEYQFLIPGNIVDPAGICYIIMFVTGTAIYLNPDSYSEKWLTAIMMVLSGFLILFGITIIGIAT